MIPYGSLIALQAKTRKIVFSCFDPDIALMTRLKQVWLVYRSDAYSHTQSHTQPKAVPLLHTGIATHVLLEV
jgi:hypothetical protein